MIGQKYKQKFGLTTNVGNDLQSAVYGISAVIVVMEPGWDRTFLIALFLITMMVIKYFTIGHEAVPPGMPEPQEEDAEEIEVPDEGEPPLETLRRGRSKV